MIEIVGDIWEQKCDWLCITTNGIIAKNGKAVMGKGIALQAKQLYPDIDKILAQKIKERGNIVSSLWWDCENKRHIISFPTKEHWRNKSSLVLISNSAKQLKEYFDNMNMKPIIMLPKPGCSCGQLDWKDVKDSLSSILIDDRFLIVDKRK